MSSKKSPIQLILQAATLLSVGLFLTAPQAILGAPASLHRVDFRIAGKSCPVCLMGIEKRLNAEPGVLKAVVMVKRPFGGTAFYDSKKTNLDKLWTAAKKGEPKVRVMDAKDEVATSVPERVIPLYRDASKFTEEQISGPKPMFNEIVRKALPQ